jgi:hypothetical protein
LLLLLNQACPAKIAIATNNVRLLPYFICVARVGLHALYSVAKFGIKLNFKLSSATAAAVAEDFSVLPLKISGARPKLLFVVSEELLPFPDVPAIPPEL